MLDMRCRTQTPFSLRQHGTIFFCVSFFAFAERKKRNTKEDQVPLRMIKNI
jgi:hypothetical protein